MITIGDYIKDEINGIKLPLTAAQLKALFLKNGIDPDSELDAENLVKAEISVLNIIPKLLLTPDKKQGDTALTWDRTAIVNYYNIKCDEYGLPNQITEENSIGTLNIW